MKDNMDDKNEKWLWLLVALIVLGICYFLAIMILSASGADTSSWNIYLML